MVEMISRGNTNKKKNDRGFRNRRRRGTSGSSSSSNNNINRDTRNSNGNIRELWD
jgi:hypothetical protein